MCEERNWYVYSIEQRRVNRQSPEVLFLISYIVDKILFKLPFLAFLVDLHMESILLCKFRNRKAV